MSAGRYRLIESARLAWVVGVCVSCFSCGATGNGSEDAGQISVCGQPVFRGACGGTVSGSGFTPIGTPFTPTAVHVALGSTCLPSGADHHLEYIEVALGSGHDFARLTFTDQPEGGVVAFLGSHEVSAQFKSFSPCTIDGGQTTIEVTSVTTSGTLEITAGDDPNVSWSARSGMLSGTFTF